MKKHLGWLTTFVVLLFWHSLHDAAWFAVGRYTDWDVQSTIPAIILVTLILTIITRVLGRHVH